MSRAHEPMPPTRDRTLLCPPKITPSQAAPPRARPPALLRMIRCPAPGSRRGMVGNWRELYAGDDVELWLDRDHLVPLGLSVRTAADADRDRWEAERGYRDLHEHLRFFKTAGEWFAAAREEGVRYGQIMSTYRDFGRKIDDELDQAALFMPFAGTRLNQE